MICRNGYYLQGFHYKLATIYLGEGGAFVKSAADARIFFHKQKAADAATILNARAGSTGACFETKEALS